MKELQRLAKIALSFLLVFSLFPVLQPVEAAEDWTEHEAKKGISTDREWKINFSDIATRNKIKNIRVESNGVNRPVTPIYDNTKTVKVKPVSRYLSGAKHTLEIELANGKKDRMDFTTAVESFANNARIYTNERIKGQASSTKKFYSIRPTEDGELKLEASSKGKMTLYLYDDDKEKGELLGFTKEDKSPTLSRDLQRNKTYYIGVVGSGDYELKTSLQGKQVTADDALDRAKKAVNALPAPSDVMNKHKYDIEQAKTFIALARLFGADSSKLNSLKIKSRS